MQNEKASLLLTLCQQCQRKNKKTNIETLERNEGRTGIPLVHDIKIVIFVTDIISDSLASKP